MIHQTLNNRFVFRYGFIHNFPGFMFKKLEGLYCHNVFCHRITLRNCGQIRTLEDLLQEYKEIQ